MANFNSRYFFISGCVHSNEKSVFEIIPGICVNSVKSDIYAEIFGPENYYYLGFNPDISWADHEHIMQVRRQKKALNILQLSDGKVAIFSNYDHTEIFIVFPKNGKSNISRTIERFHECRDFYKYEHLDKIESPFK